MNFILLFVFIFSFVAGCNSLSLSQLNIDQLNEFLKNEENDILTKKGIIDLNSHTYKEASALYDAAFKAGETGNDALAYEYSKKILLLIPDHPKYLNFSAVYAYKNSRIDEALSLNLKALNIRESILGESHLLVAQSLNNLGQSYMSKGLLNEAESSFKRALKIRESTLGADHLFIATTLSDLGSVYSSSKLYDEAEPLIRRSIEIRCASKNTQIIVECAASHVDLGLNYFIQNKLADTENEIKIVESIIHDHEIEINDSLRIYEQLSEIFFLKGDYLKSLFYLNKNRRILEKKENNNPLELARILVKISNIDILLTRFEEAEENLNHALSMRKNVLKEESVLVASIYIRLGELYNVKSDFSTAENYLMRGLEIEEKLLKQNDPVLAKNRFTLAAIYFNQGKPQKANQFIRDSLNNLKKQSDKSQYEYALKTTYQMHESIRKDKNINLKLLANDVFRDIKTKLELEENMLFDKYSFNIEVSKASDIKRECNKPGDLAHSEISEGNKITIWLCEEAIYAHNNITISYSMLIGQFIRGSRTTNFSLDENQKNSIFRMLNYYSSIYLDEIQEIRSDLDLVCNGVETAYRVSNNSPLNSCGNEKSVSDANKWAVLSLTNVSNYIFPSLDQDFISAKIKKHVQDLSETVRFAYLDPLLKFAILHEIGHYADKTSLMQNNEKSDDIEIIADRYAINNFIKLDKTPAPPFLMAGLSFFWGALENQQLTIMKFSDFKRRANEISKFYCSNQNSLDVHLKDLNRFMCFS